MSRRNKHRFFAGKYVFRVILRRFIQILGFCFRDCSQCPQTLQSGSGLPRRHFLYCLSVFFRYLPLDFHQFILLNFTGRFQHPHKITGVNGTVLPGIAIEDDPGTTLRRFGEQTVAGGIANQRSLVNDDYSIRSDLRQFLQECGGGRCIEKSIIFQNIYRATGRGKINYIFPAAFRPTSNARSAVVLPAPAAPRTITAKSLDESTPSTARA